MSSAEADTRENAGGDRDYEFRIFGANPNGYRVTDWGSRGRAVELYEKVSWDMLTFERRVPGDDSTLQRKPHPSEQEWIDVTEDMAHAVDEEVDP